MDRSELAALRWLEGGASAIVIRMTESWRHIQIDDHGTVVILRPVSDEACDWMEENVGAPAEGGVWRCEPRMEQDILQAAAGAPDLELSAAARRNGRRRMSAVNLRRVSS